MCLTCRCAPAAMFKSPFPMKCAWLYLVTFQFFCSFSLLNSFFNSFFFLLLLLLPLHVCWLCHHRRAAHVYLFTLTSFFIHLFYIFWLLFRPHFRRITLHSILCFCNGTSCLLRSNVCVCFIIIIFDLYFLAAVFLCVDTQLWIFYFLAALNRYICSIY